MIGRAADWAYHALFYTPFCYRHTMLINQAATAAARQASVIGPYTESFHRTSIVRGVYLSIFLIPELLNF